GAHLGPERGLLDAAREFLLGSLARRDVHRHAAHAGGAPARVAHRHRVRRNVDDAPVLAHPAELAHAAAPLELRARLGGRTLSVFGVDYREPEVRSREPLPDGVAEHLLDVVADEVDSLGRLVGLAPGFPD